MIKYVILLIVTQTDGGYTKVLTDAKEFTRVGCRDYVEEFYDLLPETYQRHPDKSGFEFYCVPINNDIEVEI